MAVSRIVSLGAVATLLFAACTSDSNSDTPNPDASGSPAAVGSMQLKVMEFNIEYGGEQVDFQGVINAIKAGGADVVGIEEGYGNMPKVAEGIGWKYFDPRTQVVSKYPLLAPEKSDGLYTYVEVQPGHVVAIANVHLPSKRYGPFQIDRSHASAKEVVQVEEAARMPALESPLEAVTKLAAADIPVFLMGDFNAPSHLDYTQAAVGTRKQIKFPIDWPESEAAAKAGLTDSYRAVHPDPVADPGLTWPASRPHVDGYNPGPNGAEADRIDFIYSGGPVKPTDSVIVGEQGGEGVDIPSSPWPTDHRATVSTFDVTPGEPPTIVSPYPRLVEAGDEEQITFHGPGEDGEHVAVVPSGEDPGSAGVDQPTGDGSPTDGMLPLSTEGWKPGSYDAILLGDSGQELARAPFWVQEPGGTPEIGTAKPVYKAGEPIKVEWNLAPGNRWDWIGIYKRGGNPHVAYYKSWSYTQSSVAGSFTFTDEKHGFPLDPGQYSVYLLQDDSYNKLAAGYFTVKA
jgi:endonuclease/exonuclease/phosphatase family metal-dependent hydrolase